MNLRIQTLAMIVIAITLINMALKDEAPTQQTVHIPSARPVNITLPDPVDEMVAFEDSEFECLRLNIYHEAGNQDLKGKEAIALVVMERTARKHFPETRCGVVKQAVVRNGAVVRNKCQFSWFCDGKGDRPNLNNPLERKAWEDSTQVAMRAMQGKIKDFLGGATHYHATYVNPSWAHSPRMVKVAQVGIHVFYRDIKLKRKVA